MSNLKELAEGIVGEFNPETDSIFDGGDNVLDGKYKCILNSLSHGTTSNKGTPFFCMTWKVIEGDNEGATIPVMYYFADTMFAYSIKRIVSLAHQAGYTLTTEHFETYEVLEESLTPLIEKLTATVVVTTKNDFTNADPTNVTKIE